MAQSEKERCKDIYPTKEFKMKKKINEEVKKELERNINKN